MLKKLIAFIHSDEIATPKADLDRSFRTNAFIYGSNADLRADNQRLKVVLDRVRNQRDEAARKMDHANEKIKDLKDEVSRLHFMYTGAQATIKTQEQALIKAANSEKMLRSQAGATPVQVAALRAVIAHERHRNKELEESLSGATAVLKETQDELDSVVKARDIQANTIGRQQARLQELDNLTRRGQDSSEFSIIAVESPVYFSKSGLSKVKLNGTHWAVYHTRTMERISGFRTSHAQATAVSYQAINEYNDRNRA